MLTELLISLTLFLLLTKGSLLPGEWQDLGVSLPARKCYLPSFHSQSSAPNPGTEIPPGPEEQFAIYQGLGQHVASGPLPVLQQG